MTVNIEAYTTLVYTATRALDGLIMGTKLIFCTLKYDIDTAPIGVLLSLNLLHTCIPSSTVRRDVALHPGVSLEGNCRSSLILSGESYVSNWARTGSASQQVSL